VKSWLLECSACAHTEPGTALASVCPACGQPYLVRSQSPTPGRDSLAGRRDMWRYRELLPLREGEPPVSLGEGGTPLIDQPALAREIGVRRLWVKDEGVNPTGSFKARGMSVAVTRARASGVQGVVVPTAGNAGAALAAYGAAAGLAVRVYAPDSTPAPILATVRALGAHLQLLSGHIGDAGKAAAAFAADCGFFNLATLREPYRAEGMKTMGLEVTEQLGWRFPDAVVYPTGGGEGVIGIWKAFQELLDLGWVDPDARLPRMIVAQSAGCAPLVRAFASGADRATAWPDPATHAAGLRVPSPLGDRLVLRALRESAGDAAVAGETAIRAATLRLARTTGVDAAPEGGCALVVTEQLVREGRISADAEVVLFNTGSGASYRWG
jgi:threonine synthase